MLIENIAPVKPLHLQWKIIDIFAGNQFYEMRTVKNILDSKPAVSNIVAPQALVIEALGLLNAVNLSYLIVMEGNEYRGIFSERDYSRNVILKGRTSSSTTVEEVMTVDLPAVGLTDTVEHCMHTMNVNKARYLLAYDADEKFAGVITIHDLLRQVIANREDVFDTAAAQQLLDQDESGPIY
jgi:signal-transduction protein with cAMP-binding, CBS, and nucleotidyltransferase domain